MRYWNDDQTAERDLIEGENLWDYKNPAPAVTGVKLLSNGENIIYEIEAIPGTVRQGTVVSPSTFSDMFGTVVDVVYRNNRMIDGVEVVTENTYTVMLSELGYKDSLPSSTKVVENPAFDRAMEIL